MKERLLWSAQPRTMLNRLKCHKNIPLLASLSTRNRFWRGGSKTRSSRRNPSFNGKFMLFSSSSRQPRLNWNSICSLSKWSWQNFLSHSLFIAFSLPSLLLFRRLFYGFSKLGIVLASIFPFVRARFRFIDSIDSIVTSYRKRERKHSKGEFLEREGWSERMSEGKRRLCCFNKRVT